MGSFVVCLTSALEIGCTGEDRTYRIDPLLATLSTLLNRFRLLKESLRLPKGVVVPEGVAASFLLLLSSGILGVLWSSTTEPGEKTSDPSDPSES